MNKDAIDRKFEHTGLFEKVNIKAMRSLLKKHGAEHDGLLLILKRPHLLDYIEEIMKTSKKECFEKSTQALQSHLNIPIKASEFRKAYQTITKENDNNALYQLLLNIKDDIEKIKENLNISS